MTEILMHRGGELVTKDQLDLIPLPEPTDSYMPVSHYDLADKFLMISQDILRDYKLVGENYGIARQGNQFFAVLKFQRERSEIGLSIAFRNSYDRSMAIGLAIGASVFVCDNLALSGEIVVMKKHTKNVWSELEEKAIATIYKSQNNYDQLIGDVDAFKSLPVDDNGAFQAMGLLFGNNIISPRQLTVLKEEWLKPSHEEFEPRNLWSFYNAATESLKSSPPVTIMEKHIRLHEALTYLGKEASNVQNGTLAAGLLSGGERKGTD
ncbi:DUF932 domain-containing protein [Syntrophus aciditrophicus]|uniref:Hypothetical cytosolic protein n=1 Tax=Syntrophus aciditrophicus (strain SB) TaxID=56780 RepID=Q2LV02_SYNAS|nr:DUF932 domain-containing protein [Syntrophus aciditrophicus]ABC77913.1 hypothetical cytosolic protein [Syntrophus aciditrophicus SB]